MIQRQELTKESSANQQRSGAAGNLLVNLLWTGGWDSTFRLLSLISSIPCRVQPYYIIDRDRLSCQRETGVIEKILTTCHQKPSAYVGRILSPILIDKVQIPPDSELTREYRGIADKASLGIQYEWLAGFAKQHDLNDLELYINKPPDTGTGAAPEVRRLIRDRVVLETGRLERYVLDSEAQGSSSFSGGFGSLCSS
jgi:hypothetical protein